MDFVFLGIIQGIFEWLPVSSQGIVALAGQFLNIKPDIIETALFLHLGSLFAVLIYFRKDWLEIAALKQKEFLRFLIIVTFVSLAVGYVFFNLVREMIMGAGLLALMGLGLLLTSFLQKKKRQIDPSLDSRFKIFGIRINKTIIAVLIGFLQGISVIPGVSRSGATIFGLSLILKSPQEILKVSYLISAPVILAASLYLAIKDPFLIYQVWPGLISSFLVGFIALKFLLNLVGKIDFSFFTLIFGLLCLLGALMIFFINPVA